MEQFKKSLLFSSSKLSSHYFLWDLYRRLDEDAVVSYVVSLLDLLVGDELRVAEAQGALVQRVPGAAGLLEVLPVGIRVERFSDVLGFGQRGVALVQEGESHLVGEGPLQQVVVLPGQHPDVDGQVGALAAAVAVEEGRHLQLVAVAVSVERRAEELVIAPDFGLLEFAGIVTELPDEDAVVAHRQLLHLPPQLQDLLALAAHQAAHHGQVGLGGVFQVTTNSQFGTLRKGRQRRLKHENRFYPTAFSEGVSHSVFAACIFEGAEDQSAAAVVLHVVRQVLAGDVGRPALVGTLDGKPRAVVLVVLQRGSSVLS